MTRTWRLLRFFWILTAYHLCAAAERDVFPPDFQVRRASLVYAAGYTGAPPSFFGHVFVVLADEHRIGPSRLAVQFAADLGEGMDLGDACQGLFGRLDGRYTVTPYYMLIRGYRNIEMRDLWEYGLDFNAEELQQLSEWVASHGNGATPYNFVGHNCADGLLTMLIAADQRNRLAHGRPTVLTPIGLTRFLRARGFLSEPITLPSLLSVYERVRQQMSCSDRTLMSQLALGSPVSIAPDDPQRVVLAATLRLQAMFHARELPLAHYEARLEHVQRVYNTKEKEENVISDTLPTGDPSRAHPPLSLSVLAGSIDGHGGWQIEGRLGYHDHRDESAGLMRWSSIIYLEGTLQGAWDKEDPTLRRLTIAKVESLDPGVDFRRLNAWRVQLSRDRYYATLESSEPSWELSGLMGRSARIGNSWLAYGLVGPTTRYCDDGDASNVLARAECGVLHNSSRVSGRARIYWEQPLYPYKSGRPGADLSLVVHAYRHLGLEITASTFETRKGRRDEWLAGLRIRF